MPLSLLDSVGLNDLSNAGSVVAAAGNTGLAAQFDGSNYLYIADNSDLSASDESFYVDFWVRFATVSGVQGVVSKWTFGGTDRLFALYLGVESAGRLDFRVVSAGGSDVAVASSVDLSANTWYHVRGGYNKDTTQIYITVDSTTDVASHTDTIGDDSCTFAIGRDQYSTFISSGSRIDDVIFAKSGTTTATWNFGTPASPWVSLSTSTSSIAENGGTATVSATLDNVGDLDVTVNLSFGGTATIGVDYSASSTSILIPVGQTSGSITVTAIDDATYEGDESIIIDISSVTNGTENGSQQVTITITDDDTPPALTIAAFCEDEGENMQQLFQLSQNTTAITFAMRSSTSGLLVTGLSPTVRLSKGGAAFAAASGTVGEMTLGWYSVAPIATDFDTLGPLKLLATAANCITTTKDMMVVQHSPTIGLPAAVPGSAGGLLIATATSATGAIAIDSAGNAAGDVKKWNATTVATPATAGYPAVTIKSGTGTGELSLSSGVVKATDASGANVATATALSTAQTSLNTIAGYIDTEVAAIKAKTDNLPSSPANVSDIPSTSAITSAVAAQITTDHGSGNYATATALASAQTSINTIAGYIDTEVAAIKAKTDNLPATPASTSDIPTAAAIAAAVGSGTTSNTGLSRDRVLEAIAGACCSVITGAGTSTNVVKHFNATTANLTVTVDSSGNRSAVTIS